MYFLHCYKIVIVSWFFVCLFVLIPTTPFPLLLWGPLPYGERVCPGQLQSPSAFVCHAKQWTNALKINEMHLFVVLSKLPIEVSLSSHK